MSSIAKQMGNQKLVVKQVLMMIVHDLAECCGAPMILRALKPIATHRNSR